MLHFGPYSPCILCWLQASHGIWQHTKKTNREIPVHKIFSRKGILQSPHKRHLTGLRLEEQHIHGVGASLESRKPAVFRMALQSWALSWGSQS